MRLHLGADDVGANAERLPHRTHGERNPALGVRVVDPEAQRKRVLRTKARGRKKSFCLRDPGRLRHPGKIRATRLRIVIDAGRYHAIRRRLPGTRDALHDEFAVDRHRQRASHAHVCGRPTTGVESEILKAQLRAQTQLRTEIPSQLGNLVRRQGDHHIEFARAIAQYRRFRIFDRHMMNRVELDRRRLVKARIAHEAHVAPRTPFAEHERPVRDDVRRFRPLAAVPIDHVPGHGKSAMHQQIGEVWRRVLKLDDQRERIGRTHSERRHRLHATVHVAGMTDDIEERYRGRCRLRVEESAEGPKKIFAGDGFAVGPLQVATQLEGIAATVGRNRPGLRLPRNHPRLGIKRGQSLKQVLRDIAVLPVSPQLRIERLQLPGRGTSHHVLRGNILGECTISKGERQ